MTDVNCVRADYAKHLWTLSSAVVGFSVLQTIALVYKFDDPCFRNHVAGAFVGIGPAIVIGTAIYCVAIVWIDRIQSRLLDSFDLQLRTIVEGVTVLKLAAVLVCGLGALSLSGLAWHGGQNNECHSESAHYQPELAL